LGSGSVMQTHYGPGGRADWHVVAVSGASAMLSPADFLPVPSSSELLLWYKWNDGACRAGQAARACLRALTPVSALPATAPEGAIELFHVAPAIGGWVLLGEASKIIPVAASRFVEVSASDDSGGKSGGIRAVVRGSPGELMVMLFAQVDGLRVTGEIMSKTVTFSERTATVSVP